MPISTMLSSTFAESLKFLNLLRLTAKPSGNTRVGPAERLARFQGQQSMGDVIVHSGRNETAEIIFLDPFPQFGASISESRIVGIGINEYICVQKHRGARGNCGEIH